MHELERLVRLRALERERALLPSLFDGRVERALAAEMDRRPPMSVRGCAEMALDAYCRLGHSHELIAARRVRVLGLVYHRRLGQWYKELHRCHAQHGHLRPSEALRFLWELASVVCEGYFHIIDIGRSAAYSHLRVIVEGYEQRQGRQRGSTRKALLDEINAGNGFEAVVKLVEILSAGEESSDSALAREYLEMDHHSETKVEMSKLIAERVNEFLERIESPYRAHEMNVYGHFAEIVDLYREGSMKEIVDLIGYRAYR